MASLRFRVIRTLLETRRVEVPTFRLRIGDSCTARMVTEGKYRFTFSEFMSYDMRVVHGATLGSRSKGSAVRSSVVSVELTRIVLVWLWLLGSWSRRNELVI